VHSACIIVLEKLAEVGLGLALSLSSFTYFFVLILPVWEIESFVQNWGIHFSRKLVEHMYGKWNMR
jgi:hypothetical protein